MDLFSSAFLFSLASIILLDLVLGGDNAVVIAMASQKLPLQLRKKAIYIGTLGAIVIRVIMTIIASYILTIPCIQALGGLILLPIACKLIKPSSSTSSYGDTASTSFAGAVKTIIIADAAMGIDNVLAIAGAAHGNMLLVLVGLAISVPIVIWGSQLIASLMDRFPILITAGAALLAYTGATMVLHDKIIGTYILTLSSLSTYILPIGCIAAVLLYGKLSK